ncbi:MAG: UDP-glucose--hexose-1-phosphate uridylyltransferase [Chloroflexi bacterium]|nr:UDP-glucose--hexose-1-phosphate uridylyltransferase [Chloroflexota bacterium]
MTVHRRHNPLTGDWVLVSPHRMNRPWHGQVEQTEPSTLPTYDPECYLCPGNQRANGGLNPDYKETFVFTNDFAALLPEADILPEAVEDPLFQSQPVRGTCRVICYSPRHDLAFAAMDLPAIRQVVDVWCAQTEALGRIYPWVQVFQNKGTMMGASNPHPHGQIWAGDWLPVEAAKEDHSQAAYRQTHGSTLLLDYARAEINRGERLVELNDDWLAVVPYWALWPYEILLLPYRRPIRRLPELSPRERDSLAGILKQLLIRCDALFSVPFPYSMGWHGAPFTQADSSHWHLHAHFYPPLLRSATVRKFMVGYEMLAEPQRDLTPEAAAHHLRSHGTSGH